MGSHTASYANQMKVHLAAYKQNVLKIHQSGTWRDREYKHILPSANIEMNVLPAIRSDLFAYIESTRTLKLHRDFAHLNSSQAACFNFFFPILMNPTSYTSKLLSLKGTSIKEWEFEHVSVESEGTNFDLWVLNNDGSEAFVEFKLTENEFGIEKNDLRHREKLKNIYYPNLKEKIASEFLEPDLFFKHYQLLRNVSYANPELPATVIFLVPKANRSIEPSLSRVMAALTPRIRQFVRVLFLEDLVNKLRHESASSASSYFDEFAEKYLPEIDGD